MAKARKLKSGSWRVQVYDYTDDSGKKHYRSFTADTKARAEYMAAEFKAGGRTQKKSPDDITVAEAIEKYIELSEVLSPSTIHNYKRMAQYGFQSIMQTPVSKLDNEAMQHAINLEAKRIFKGKRISAKTVKNEYGLLSAALKTVCGLTFSVKLPTVQRQVKEFPEPDAVMNAIIGSSIELPCLLAVWLSFSLSEIRGLTCSSIKGDEIYINQVMININGEDIVKPNAKVETRLRKHRIPGYIMQLIEQQESYQRYKATGEDGPLIELTAPQLSNRWRRISRANGLGITFHGLRHMNASIMLMLNIPERYAMERGGWKTPHTMKQVYQHTFSKERQQVDNMMDDYFDALLNITQEYHTKTEKP